MSKPKITSCLALICMAIILVGVTTAEASEVTGTLSSLTANAQASGDINGTVIGSGSNGGNGSSGGGGVRNNSNSSPAPTGSVLGATTSNISAPSFPNAGTIPQAGSDQTLWSTIKTFIHELLSF